MSKLLDEILSKENMTKAYKSVCANKGSAGIDGISTDDIQAYVNGHWDDIKSQIRTR